MIAAVVFLIGLAVGLVARSIWDDMTDLYAIYREEK